MQACHPSGRHAPSRRVTSRGHTSRDAAGPATAPGHNIHPCPARGGNTAQFTELDMDSRRMLGTGFSVKKLYVQGDIYIIHTHTYIYVFVCVCVLFTDK